jgi:uncharacterized membrane protein
MYNTKQPDSKGRSFLRVVLIFIIMGIAALLSPFQLGYSIENPDSKTKYPLKTFYIIFAIFLVTISITFMGFDYVETPPLRGSHLFTWTAILAGIISLVYWINYYIREQAPVDKERRHILVIIVRIPFIILSGAGTMFIFIMCTLVCGAALLNIALGDKLETLGNATIREYYETDSKGREKLYISIQDPALDRIVIIQEAEIHRDGDHNFSFIRVGKFGWLYQKKKQFE